MAEKVRENRLRAMAKRQGLLLQKSRRRDTLAFDYGKWYVIDPAASTLVLEFVTLDEVEEWLLQPRHEKQSSHARVIVLPPDPFRPGGPIVPPLP